MEIKTRGKTAAAIPEITIITKKMTGVSMIVIPQEKRSCTKVGIITISKFQQKIIPILKTDIQNFREENLENYLTKWKNVTSKIIL